METEEEWVGGRVEGKQVCGGEEGIGGEEREETVTGYKIN